MSSQSTINPKAQEYFRRMKSNLPKVFSQPPPSPQPKASPAPLIDIPADVKIETTRPKMREYHDKIFPQSLAGTNNAFKASSLNPDNTISPSKKTEIALDGLAISDDYKHARHLPSRPLNDSKPSATETTPNHSSSTVKKPWYPNSKLAKKHNANRPGLYDEPCAQADRHAVSGKDYSITNIYWDPFVMSKRQYDATDPGSIGRTKQSESRVYEIQRERAIADQSLHPYVRFARQYNATHPDFIAELQKQKNLNLDKDAVPVQILGKPLPKDDRPAPQAKDHSSRFEHMVAQIKHLAEITEAKKARAAQAAFDVMVNEEWNRDAGAAQHGDRKNEKKGEEGWEDVSEEQEDAQAVNNVTIIKDEAKDKDGEEDDEKEESWEWISADIIRWQEPRSLVAGGGRSAVNGGTLMEG